MLQFHNSFIHSLPGYSPQVISSEQTPNVCYALVKPQPVSNPQLLASSAEVLDLLGISVQEFLSMPPQEVFSGNKLLSGMQPFAARYGGHQFGHWAGQLGDGRAISLGEVISQGQRWEIQLKGSGPTPYSRSADGRAVLRSSIREFICSEAMHFLDVPSTRALCLVATGEGVIRDMLYSGNPQTEPGAIVTRVAPSFLRFGNFQILSAHQELELLEKLLNYTIETHFSELLKIKDAQERYLHFFTSVVMRTAELMVQWMRVGFVHGVMNTDNMSILGLTIDYGPYGWLEQYEPFWTPNTTDLPRRRYAFQNQPGIALWNLERLAEALAPLMAEPKLLRLVLEDYEPYFLEKYWQMRQNKLGLTTELQEEGYKKLEALDPLLLKLQLDYTLFYNELAEVFSGRLGGQNFLERVSYKKEISENEINEFQQWLQEIKVLYPQGDLTLFDRALMEKTNPFIIPRNYLTLEVITSVLQGDVKALHDYHQALKTPYVDSALTRRYYGKRPASADHQIGASQLSCSS